MAAGGLLSGGNSWMAVLLALLGAPCLLFLGVGLWVICSHSLTVTIPVGIGHPMKLRVLYCALQLLIAWVSFVPLFVPSLGRLRRELGKQSRSF